jgi:hypothetical protein
MSILLSGFTSLLFLIIGIVMGCVGTAKGLKTYTNEQIIDWVRNRTR